MGVFLAVVLFSTVGAKKEAYFLAVKVFSGSFREILFGNRLVNSVLSFNFAEVVHLFLLEEVVYAAKMLDDALVGEFIYFGNKAVKEVTVMGNYD